MNDIALHERDFPCCTRLKHRPYKIPEPPPRPHKYNAVAARALSTTTITTDSDAPPYTTSPLLDPPQLRDPRAHTSPGLISHPGSGPELRNKHTGRPDPHPRRTYTNFIALSLSNSAATWSYCPGDLLDRSGRGRCLGALPPRLCHLGRILPRYNTVPLRCEKRIWKTVKVFDGLNTSTALI